MAPPAQADPAPDPAPADAAAAQETTLLDVLDALKAWGPDPMAFLDSRARLAFYRASRDCRLSVVEASEQATVTLLMYGGIPEAVWQQRLASAEPDLITRGLSQRSTKLVLRSPTHNAAALEHTLKIAPAAGRAVTELVLRAYDYSPQPVPQQADRAAVVHTTHTKWLRDMPAAFPHLRTLHLHHICGCLPDPALMPLLRGLHVTIRGRSEDREPPPQFESKLRAKCVSIARYVPQLTSLNIDEYKSQLHRQDWGRIFSTVSHTLTEFSTSSSWRNEYIPLLVQYAPALKHVACEVWQVFDGFSGASWAVERYTPTRAQLDLGLAATLPQGPRLTLSAQTTKGQSVTFHVTLDGAQGLCDAVRRRLPEWHVEAPTRVQVSLPFHLPADDIRHGMQCAMRQLSVLPAGSDIHWAGSTHLPSIIKDGGPPRVDSDVCQWPWRSVTSGSCRKDGLGGRMVFFSSLLELRRPTGPCDLDITALHDNTYAHKWTPDMFAELERRLQHYTFVARHDSINMHLTAPQRLPTDSQPAALRRTLQVLGSIRWRYEASSIGCTVYLRQWTITPAFMRELAALPTFDGRPVTLDMQGCHWSPECDYEQLPSLVPASYSTWQIEGILQRDSQPFVLRYLQAICMGAKARGEGAERLVLQVSYNKGLTDPQRSHLERLIDARGLGRWVEIDWHSRAEY